MKGVSRKNASGRSFRYTFVVPSDLKPLRTASYYVKVVRQDLDHKTLIAVHFRYVVPRYKRG